VFLDKVQNVEIAVPGTKVNVTTTLSKQEIEDTLKKTGKSVVAL
jgi:hypothetical protein